MIIITVAVLAEARTARTLSDLVTHTLTWTAQKDSTLGKTLLASVRERKGCGINSLMSNHTDCSRNQCRPMESTSRKLPASICPEFFREGPNNNHASKAVGDPQR